MLSSKCAPLVRGLATTASACAPVKNVTIIGAGLMGSGIAQVSANAKLNVTLVDQSADAVAKAQKSIDSSLRRVAKKKAPEDSAAQKAFVDATMQYLKTSTKIGDAVASADLVIEAIVENIDIKKTLFKQVEEAAPSNAIITTNTSSLRLVDIGADLKNKSQFGGLHFFNPVPMMKLLEVVRHAETSDATFSTLMEYGKTIGKVTVSCKDTPGFIVNRLLVPYMFSALEMLERGDASAKDIDVAMKLGAGYPMGPLELSDYVGLDTCKFIMDGWAKQYPNDPTFKANKVLNKLVSEGKFGRKTGEGFYKY